MLRDQNAPLARFAAGTTSAPSFRVKQRLAGAKACFQNKKPFRGNHINVAILIATFFGGTLVAERINHAVRGAALKKAAHGLPGLSRFARGIRASAGVICRTINRRLTLIYPIRRSLLNSSGNEQGLPSKKTGDRGLKLWYTIGIIRVDLEAFMIAKKLTKVGNTQAVVLDKTLLSLVDANADSMFKVSIEGKKIVLELMSQKEVDRLALEASDRIRRTQKNVFKKLAK